MKSIRSYISFAGVSVTGGCESLALTLLARETFPKVIGITVDHRLVRPYQFDVLFLGQSGARNRPG